MKRITSLAAKIAPKVSLPMIALMALAMAIPLPETHVGTLWDKILLILTDFAIIIVGFVIGAYYAGEYASKK